MSNRLRQIEDEWDYGDFKVAKITTPQGTFYYPFIWNGDECLWKTWFAGGYSANSILYVSDGYNTRDGARRAGRRQFKKGE